MQPTYLWELLLSLSKSEIREVKNFLDSPFFNHRQDLRQLFDLLAQHVSSGKEPEKEAVFAQLFPGKNFDGQLLRLTQSYLLKLLEQYLIFKENQADPLAQAPLLLAAYRRRKLDRSFEKTQKAVQAQLEAQALRHPDFHLAAFRSEHQQYLHLLAAGRTRELNLQSVETHLTQAMLAMKLRQACLLRAHQAVFKTTYRIDLLEETLALAALPPYSETPAISVYRHCYLALFAEQDGDATASPAPSPITSHPSPITSHPSPFAEFKEQLFRHGDCFPKEEMASLYLLALNFCIKKINENQKNYLREALDLYQQGLKNELLLEDGKLSRFAFNNIVGIALRLEDEWEWVEWFVKNYRPLLDPAHREATFSLNSARLAYARRRFDEALVHLQRADYKDLINAMVAKVLQLKIYFETGELELLDAHLRTMRMFVRRNKRMGYHHRNWQNIIRFTQKLVELNPFDESRRAALRSEIETEEVLTEKEWLMGQLLG